MHVSSAHSRKKAKQNRNGRPPLSVSSPTVDQHSLASSTTTSVAPIKHHDELHFDDFSRASTLYRDEDDTSEKLVQGEKAESIILSARSSQEHSISPRDSPGYDNLYVSANIKPSLRSKEEQPTPNKLLNFEDIVEERMHMAKNQFSVPFYVKLSRITSKSLKSIKWNGNNDPYIIISIGDWSCETEVVWSAPEVFTWPDTDIVGVCDSKENSNMLFSVYNANLVRDDQIIGVGSVSLEDIRHGEPQEVEIDIIEQGGKLRYRGAILVTLTVTDEKIETSAHCNSHHVGKKEALEKAETILNINHKTYDDKENDSSKKTDVQPSAQPPRSDKTFIASGERKIKNPVRRTSTSSQERIAKQQVNEFNDSKKQTRISPEKEICIKPSLNSFPPSSRNYSRSKSSSSLQDISQQERETKCLDNEEHMHKSNIVQKKKKRHSNKRKKDNMNDIKCKLYGSSDTTRIIDKAFQMALNDETAVIRLSTYEVALVLDALGIELSCSPKQFLANQAADVSDDVSFRSGRTNTSENRESVLISLQNPPLLAAALSDFFRDKAMVKRNLKSSRPFSLTEKQAVSASNHLNSLVRGDWASCRKIMLMAATNKGVTSEDNRPEYWGPHWISKLLAILQMPGLNLSEDSGHDFTSLTEEEINSRIKPSILRMRCRVYRKLMNYLNEFWGMGRKPQDPVSGEPPSKEDEGKPKEKRKSSRNILDGDYVKIAKAETLLKAMIPLHRAYAWSATVEDLTYFCNIVGGSIGMTMKHPPYGSKVKTAHGMRWITFPEDATLSHSNISILLSLRELDENSIEFISGRCIYVPQCCLKKYTSPVSVNPGENSAKAINLPVSNLCNRDVTVGMKVKVLDIDSLYRAYERFDWWERPSIATLTNMADRPGVIVSLPVPTGKDYKRYGVSVVTKSGDEIIDALPPDAMEEAPVALAMTKPDFTSSLAPSNRIVKEKDSDAPIKSVQIKIPDYGKPTDSSIRNQVNFANLTPPKDLPFVRFDSNVTEDTGNNLRPVEEDYIEEVFDMDAPTGGDESFLPPEVNSYDEIEENLRLDARVKEKDDIVDIKITRPLYRPLTPSHINKYSNISTNHVNKFMSTVPRGNATETFSDTNNYGWIKKQNETVDEFDERVPPKNDGLNESVEKAKGTKSPPAISSKKSGNAKPGGRKSVRMQTAQLGLLSSDDSSPTEHKDIPRFRMAVDKSRARTERAADRQTQFDLGKEMEDNMLFFDVGSDSEEDIDFGISGLGFTGAKASIQVNNESPKRYPRRPVSANRAIKSSFQPKTAASHSRPRRSSPAKGSDDTFVVKSSNHHIPSPADDVNYLTAVEKARMRRELQRTEKEAKAKEKSLLSQLKSLGITVQDIGI